MRTVLDGLVEQWVRFGRPLPATVVRARGILDRTLTCAMSLQRQEFEADEGESNSDYIGVREAAGLLGVTRRTVQRNAIALGGQLVSGSWVFGRNEVEEIRSSGHQHPWLT